MKIVIIAMLLLTVMVCSSCRALTPSEMQIQRVIDVDNAPKVALFDKSRMWYASNFRSANAVIQYENKDNGTIMGNGSVSDSIMMVRYTLRFSIATEVKDNKARITATGQNLYTEKGGEINVNERMWNHFKEEIESMINSYAGYIQNASANAKHDNW